MGGPMFDIGLRDVREDVLGVESVRHLWKNVQNVGLEGLQ